MTRNIDAVIPPPPYHWVGNGFRVHNFFPNSPQIGMKRMSPFFLLDYASKHEFQPGDSPRGVDVHPHRGIETVTIAYKGKVAHHDSAGNSGVISEGDVQWMTAGSGILHKEYHEEEFNKNGGIFQIIQLWVNLRSKDKMTTPKYQDLPFSEGNKYILPDDGGIVNVIAGKYKDVEGKATTFTPVNLFDVRLLKDSEADFTFDETHNTGMMVVEGEILVNNERTVKEDNFVLFGNNGIDIKIKALSEAKLLIMSGEPIDEPIVPYGPFVMNTREEINQTIEDFKSGKFGYLK